MFLLKFFVSFLAFLLILSYDLVVCCYHFVLLYLLKIFTRRVLRLFGILQLLPTSGIRASCFDSIAVVYFVSISDSSSMHSKDHFRYPSFGNSLQDHSQQRETLQKSTLEKSTLHCSKSPLK